MASRNSSSRFFIWSPRPCMGLTPTCQLILAGGRFFFHVPFFRRGVHIHAHVIAR
jgi:hypothetical protein